MIRIGLFIGCAVLGLTVGGLFYHAAMQRAALVAVQQERSRVATTERKIDAKIIKKQRAAAGQPASSVLDRWSVE